MPAHRIRFCPKGHDKDAPNGSLYYTVKSLKGTIMQVRCCAVCRREYVKKSKAKHA